MNTDSFTKLAALELSIPFASGRKPEGINCFITAVT